MLDNLKSQRKAKDVLYKLLVENCKYFNKDAYSNTFTNSKKVKNE